MKPCIYCGNNPVPHKTHKFYESIEIFIGPVRRRIFNSTFGRAADKFTDLLALGLLHILKPLGLVKINRDVNLVPYPRAAVLWQEAINRNIDFEELKPFGRSIDLYRARLPSPTAQAVGGQTKIENKYLYFMNLPHKESVSSSNLSWIDDKFLLKQKLIKHHLPVSAGSAFTRLSKALKAFEILEKPVIVKPRTGSRGRHTTTLIYSKEDFINAFRIAKQLCHWVIVEEHLFGDVQRGTLIGGKLIGVLGGSSPQISGDGIHTIAELIKIKDSSRPEKVKEIKINPHYLKRQGYNLDSVLEKDKTIPLSEKIGVNYGGTSYDITKETHPDTKQMLEEVAKVLDLSIIGLDFIIPDITKSHKEQKMGIIECNGAPFLQLHYDPLIGETIPAAKYVWDLVS